MFKSEYPKCPDAKQDCFAAIVRYQACTYQPICACKILTEGIPNCPFYKTIDEYKRGVKHEKGES